jgi:hypothetical protein
MKFFIASFLFATVCGTIGCNSLVDSAPSASQPVLKVEDYYLPLKNIGASFTYCRKTATGADTILMTMQGQDISGVMPGNGMCYAADLTKTNHRLYDYYYSMNDSEAYTLGKLSCGSTEKYWLDLKAPLTVGQTWKFSNTNGSYYLTNYYTAKVSRRGATMKMPDGTIYNDVTEVIYLSQSGDSTVKWFAKGTGLIYCTSKEPDSDFGQEMRLLGQN